MAKEEELPQEHHANAICCGFSRGTDVATLAKRHDVSEQLVRDVLEGRRYGHMTGRGPHPARQLTVVGNGHAGWHGLR